MDFRDGFSVLTGETGAGKSILLGALGLVLGDRADTSVLRETTEKCVVEGFFTEPRLSSHPVAIACDLEGETDWCIRREVGANGKSRAFLNDTPITLTQLQSFATELVDLHQQFDTLELTEADRQRALLDVMAGIPSSVEEYSIAFSAWKNDLQTLRSLEDQQLRIRQEQEYDQHILAELEDASFRPQEIEQLEEKVRLAGQSEGMAQALSEAVEKLQGDEAGLEWQLRKLLQVLTPYEKTDDTIGQWSARLRSVELELRELSREMDRFGAQSQSDPKLLAEWQERLSLGFRLMKKHGAKQTQELIDLQTRLSEKIQSSHNLEAQIETLRSSTRNQADSLRAQAEVLHNARAAVIEPWTEQVNRLLHQVGMPTARFGVSLHDTELNATGKDNCVFLLDANFATANGLPVWQPIRKVASGGELSRLMLCVKSLVADKMQLPTLIFDEIDTGISGEAAKQVGLLLQALGQNRQVICVTHQPQVAAKGQHHWHVSKAETPRGIETQVDLLSTYQRVEALARILGGESPSDTARQAALELLNR